MQETCAQTHEPGRLGHRSIVPVLHGRTEFAAELLTDTHAVLSSLHPMFSTARSARHLNALSSSQHLLRQLSCPDLPRAHMLRRCSFRKRCETLGAHQLPAQSARTLPLLPDDPGGSPVLLQTALWPSWYQGCHARRMRPQLSLGVNSGLQRWGKADSNLPALPGLPLHGCT